MSTDEMIFRVINSKPNASNYSKGNTGQIELATELLFIRVDDHIPVHTQFIAFCVVFH